MGGAGDTPGVRPAGPWGAWPPSEVRGRGGLSGLPCLPWYEARARAGSPHRPRSRYGPTWTRVPRRASTGLEPGGWGWAGLGLRARPGTEAGVGSLRIPGSLSRAGLGTRSPRPLGRLSRPLPAGSG